MEEPEPFLVCVLELEKMAPRRKCGTTSFVFT
jgi:hypothetical protein